MKHSTRSYWSAVLDDFARSGLGVREFCGRRGVSVQAFYLRRRQVARCASPRAFIEAHIRPELLEPDIVIERPPRQRVIVPRDAGEKAVATVLRGNQRGGETAAMLAGFAATCKRHGVNPRKYQTQALVNVPHVPAGELERWLPDRWKVLNQERERAAGG